MSVLSSGAAYEADQTSWTRDLARDLFPTAVIPFHWTLLRRPVQVAMQRTWADLGAILPPEDFWRWGDDGCIYLNASLVAQAGRVLHGAAWIGVPPEEARPDAWRWHDRIEPVQYLTESSSRRDVASARGGHAPAGRVGCPFCASASAALPGQPGKSIGASLSC